MIGLALGSESVETLILSVAFQLRELNQDASPSKVAFHIANTLFTDLDIPERAIAEVELYAMCLEVLR